MEELKLAYKYHVNWLEIVQSFGCNIDTAEDIVSEMYIRLHKIVSAGKDITYNNDINRLYVFKILTTIFLDFKRKESKMHLVEYSYNIDNRENIEIDYNKYYEKIKKTLDTLYWYDQKVYEIIEKGESISELSRKTNISYYSLYNTYKKVKRILKEII